MIRLPPFAYYAPQTVAEAVALKARYGPEAMYVAGGTDLYPKMKRRQMTPRVLIGLGDVAELRLVAPVNGGAGSARDSQVMIGAGLTLAEVAAHPLLVAHYPALARAAGLAASPPLRNSGTLGGNLCLDTRCNYYDQSYEWREALGFCLKKDGDVCQVARSSPRCVAVSSSDCAPVVIALDAVACLVGPQGERTIPAASLYRDDGANYLTKSAEELLTAIYLPPTAGWRSAYVKLRRRGSIDFPVFSAAAALRLAKDGRCLEARLVLGAVGPRPLLVPAAVTAPLIGQQLTAELIAEVAQAAARLARPLDNSDMSAGYRKKMVSVYIAGALAEAAAT
jgi:4-hydroxybenzoyl-CoA reductase subunit beta